MKEVVAPVAGDAVEEAPATEGKRLTELPMDEVQFILAQKPLPIFPPEDRETLVQFYPPEMIDRIIETERREAEASAAIQEDFFAFQDWVREEFELHGVVKVDDEFLARREQTCQWLREEFDDLFNRLENERSDADIGNYSDMYATDDDEEEDALDSISNSPTDGDDEAS